jgi:hypothetical protein
VRNDKTLKKLSNQDVLATRPVALKSRLGKSWKGRVRGVQLSEGVPSSRAAVSQHTRLAVKSFQLTQKEPPETWFISRPNDVRTQ